MPTTHQLHVINDAGVPGMTVALFATVPVQSGHEPFWAAWQVATVAGGAHTQFTWDLTWGFAFQLWAPQPGMVWLDAGWLPAAPGTTAASEARLRWDDGSPTLEPVDLDTLRIDGDPSLPPPARQAVSVGLMLDGRPICATATGPGEQQVFTTRPAYALAVGDYLRGQLVDGGSVAGFLPLDFPEGVDALTAEHRADGTWTVTPAVG